MPASRSKTLLAAVFGRPRRASHAGQPARPGDAHGTQPLETPRVVADPESDVPVESERGADRRTASSYALIGW
ncbi:hypothetical protein Kfla_6474 [Kribbella flavida DSM 17836]|uniref:Uncharacterized protein n=1 Tax=Kribbella flavida (strain DSM 17836 / JCM 10339 / NBRC 14399) TaxID=479435 RepID=D2PYA3_KRIFD|nr:hypothetical protein [Kribbella flavida]ADB35471.1 hypothetical protein Kfla_6474 [Kribbella flavida DSM 17836]